MSGLATRFMIGMGILLVFFQWSSAQQWTQTSGPGGGSVQCFAANGSKIFAGTWSGGVFLTTNSGTSWTAVNSGLPTDSWVYSLADSGSKIFAGTNTGVYLSTNNGATWSVTDTGQLNTGVLSLAVLGTRIVAGTDGHGVFYSTDFGTTWDRVAIDSLSLDSTRVFSLLVSGTIIFAGGDSGVFRSSDSIADWTKVNSGLTTNSVRSLASNSSYVFAGTNGGGVFRSTISATPTWTAENSGLTNTSVQSLVVSGSNLLAGTNGGGVFLSSNNGSSWTAVNSGLPTGALDILSLWVNGSNLYAGTVNGGVFQSSTSGTPSWTAVNSGLANTYVQSLAVNGSYLFAGLKFGGGVVSSTTNGSTWTTINPGQPTDTCDILSLAVSGSNLFAGTDSGGVFQSTNNGSSWSAFNSSGLTNMYIQSLVVSGSNLLAGTIGGGVFQSSTGGASWTAVNSGLTNMYVQSLVVSGSYIYAGTRGGGVFQSSTSGTPSWTAVNSGLPMDTCNYSLAVSGTNIFVGTDSGVFLSANNGASWTAVNTGLPTLFINSLTAIGANIFAGTYGDGIYLSTTNGASWTAFGSGLTNDMVLSLSATSSYLFAGTGGGGVWNASLSGLTITPGAPVLASPTNGSVNQPTTLTLNWGSMSGATSYGVQVSISSSFSSTVFSQTGLTGLSTAVSGLTNNATYYWQANATNAGGTSAWSSAWNFTTVVAASGIPSLASPTSGSVNQPVTPNLSWGSVSGAASYGVQVAIVSNFSSTVFSQTGLTGLSATVSGLTNNSTYYWQANATNAGGTSAWSSAWNFTTVVAAPGIPSLASPTSGSVNQPVTLNLNWGSVSGAASYAVQVATSSTFSGTVFEQAGLTVLSATVGGLANSSTYYWQANATNIGGSSIWSGAWSFTTIIAAPGVPGLSSPTNGTAIQQLPLILSWGSVSGAVSYGVQIATDQSFGSTVFSGTGLTTLSVTVSGLANNTTYYWQANAANIGGGGNWSGAWSFTTNVAAPAAPALTSPTNNALNQPVSLNLNWSSVSNAVSFTVQVATSSSFTVSVFSESGLTTLSATVSGLAHSTTYYWQANATDIGGSGIWSGTWSFTTTSIVAPGAPALSSPTNGAVNQPVALSLSWGTVSGATSYGVQGATDQNFGSTVFSESGLTTLSATVSGLANGTTYYWQANAANIGGTSVWTGAWTFTTVIAAPDIPLLSSPANNAAGLPATLSLSWGSSARAVEYALQVSTASAFTSTVISQAGITAMAFPIGGLANNVTYYWEVCAANIGGTSAWTVAWNFTTVAKINLPILSGWNMVSFNIRFADSCIGSIIRMPAGPDSFLLVKDGAGHACIPTECITDLDTVHTGQGYQVYASADDTVRAQGPAVDVAATPLSLGSEWNMVGYLPQVSMQITSALNSITPQILLVKNNSGRVYWPDYGINTITTMNVGAGYWTCMKSPATLTYPAAKERANVRQMLSLPDPRHYASHAITGNNATLLAKRVIIGGKTVPDSSEIAAFDEKGALVGAGCVVHGLAAFTVWGNDPRAKGKNGAAANEPISFKLWDGMQEYPLDFMASNGSGARYSENAVFLGSLTVSPGALIKKFDLSKAYPNPFRGSVHIVFDVPMINGNSEQNIAIEIYDLEGRLVEQLAKDMYRAGHYAIQWDAGTDRNMAAPSRVYIVRMQADRFDKRLKIIRMRN